MGEPLAWYGIDWIAMVLTLVALVGLGNHQRWGFAVGMVSNVAWGTFAVLVGSTPTLVTNALCLLLSLRGWVIWGRRVTPSVVPDGR